MQFVAIDVETANADRSSICQIGLARFADGEPVEQWCTLVDPDDHFDAVNVSIHGIKPRMVKGYPNLPQIADRLRHTLEGSITVSHTGLDRTALDRAYSKYNLRPLATTWLDSAQVARRAWKDVAWKGHDLANVCSRIGHKFKPHDALEDARAAGFVLLAALRESQRDLNYWLRKVTEPIDAERPHIERIDSERSYTKRSPWGITVRRDGDPEGTLYGETLVFTGELQMPRTEAATLPPASGVMSHPA